jgi:CRP-like cAMP-binding protein
MLLPEELQRIKVLQNLSMPYVNQIALMAQLNECQEGTVLFCEGQDSPFLYFVLSGCVDLEVAEPGGESVEIYTAGPGELIGWSPLLGRQAMTATARAATRCRLVVLDVDRLVALCEDNPRFGLAFLRQIALTVSERLAHTRRCLAPARYLSQRSPFLVAP